jgi:hemoglobin
MESMSYTQLTSERRAAMTKEIQAETGIDEALIHQLVHSFYARVRKDPVIGPIFNNHVADWDKHLAQMCSFWSSVALMTGTYHGQPMQKHQPLPADGRHFDRWLELFEDTANKVCSPKAAMHFIERARRVAQSLELGMASSRGVMLMKGERLHRPDLDA